MEFIETASRVTIKGEHLARLKDMIEQNMDETIEMLVECDKAEILRKIDNVPSALGFIGFLLSENADEDGGVADANAMIAVSHGIGCCDEEGFVRKLSLIAPIMEDGSTFEGFSMTDREVKRFSVYGGKLYEQSATSVEYGCTIPVEEM